MQPLPYKQRRGQRVLSAALSLLSRHLDHSLGFLVSLDCSNAASFSALGGMPLLA